MTLIPRSMCKPLSVAAIALGASLGAQAQVVNGNFASGLDQWAAYGDVYVVANTLTLTSAFAGDDGVAATVSGQNAVWIDTLEPQAGAAPYGLDFAGEAAYEGALAQQTFTVAAGQSLGFEWSFSTHETGFSDNAFVVINGNVVNLASRGTPTGWQAYGGSFAQTGPVTLSFGVVDTGDTVGTSTLQVRNVTVSAVPEPEGWALWAAGSALLAGLTGRRKR